eukprot:3541282-Amphidinium_carterae.1
MPEHAMGLAVGLSGDDVVEYGTQAQIPQTHGGAGATVAPNLPSEASRPYVRVCLRQRRK